MPTKLHQRQRSASRGVTPRIGSSLYTAKHPGRCPNCGGTNLSRKGSRRKKFETVQRWHCSACGRGFTPAPPELRAKTYPLRVILDGVTLYNLGYTLTETSTKLKTRTGYRVPSSTLAAWISEHRDLTTYARLREEGRALFKPAQAIRSTKLYHRQVYEYAYHQPKLAFLRQSPEHNRFDAVADFLEAVPTRCPHDLFQASARASESAPAFLDRSRLSARPKENFATRLAQLVIPSVGDNYRRHETLQRFMLANDSVTLAVEVPIWLTPADIRALEREHGIALRSRSKDQPADQTITGHIDFLQVRNGAVHILDYKPDARTNKPFAQLTIYALALTRLIPGLRLFDVKCAWFNEEQYCEFFPRTALKTTS
jgi:ATP-dependent exoDNAse (exonuclease V) beta subunit